MRWIRRLGFSFFLLAGFMIAGCAGWHEVEVHTPKSLGGYFPYKQEGIASWYGRRFRGKKTASGERFNPEALTCAHRTLPFGSRLRVTNLKNKKIVIVTVNDRGPMIRSRLIDLSHAAAKVLGFERAGTSPVRVESIARK